jgi:hypothetical protein
MMAGSSEKHIQMDLFFRLAHFLIRSSAFFILKNVQKNSRRQGVPLVSGCPVGEVNKLFLED